MRYTFYFKNAILGTGLFPRRKLALLAAPPQQLEFTTALSFDQVEISFAPGAMALNLSDYPTTDMLYAYGTAPGVPKQVTASRWGLSGR